MNRFALPAPRIGNLPPYTHVPFLPNHWQKPPCLFCRAVWFVRPSDCRKIKRPS